MDEVLRANAEEKEDHSKHKEGNYKHIAERYSPKLNKALKYVDDWSFDIIEFANACGNKPIQTLASYLLDRYQIIDEFKIDRKVLAELLKRIEVGYQKHNTIYHTNVHGADVMRNFHCMLQNSNLVSYLTPLDIFASLIAALIHDYEHTGTTNNFHVITRSPLAMLYNDRMVLQNHHISAFFTLLRNEELNILAPLTTEQYTEFRALVIEMVLSTDMSYHFQLLRQLHRQIKKKEEKKIDKPKVLALVLHVCDFCYPAKKWDIANTWAHLNISEFFKQGDLERKLGLPISPQCDREKCLLSDIQIQFIEIILEPALRLCGIILDHSLPYVCAECKNMSNNDIIRMPSNCNLRKVWEQHLEENKVHWRERSVIEKSAQGQSTSYFKNKGLVDKDMLTG